MQVNAVGSYRLNMRDLPDQLLTSALLVVDECKAAMEESGEIHHATGAGVPPKSDLVELSSALSMGVIMPSTTVEPSSRMLDGLCRTGPLDMQWPSRRA